MVNIVSPFDEVVVSAPTKPRKQRKLQVIMSIDQTGKEQETA
jgi:hypothetical protein